MGEISRSERARDSSIHRAATSRNRPVTPQRPDISEEGMKRPLSILSLIPGLNEAIKAVQKKNAEETETEGDSA